MSRLDYVTVAIVGICILAIAFLVYKMTNVFNAEKPKDNTEIASDSVETEDDSVYDYEIDQNVDSNGVAATDKTSTTKPANTTEQSATNAPAEDDEEKVPSSTSTTTHSGSSASDSSEKTNASSGKYMVLAGSFTKKALADAQVKKLNKLGYNHAQVEIFDRGKYAVVLVDRFGNMADAERTVKKLNGDGVKSYVKIKS
ncbi:MAG: hypothetical protein GC192_00170 [Bacteroidetes bacterium]|nr:hypothetical protein [Bacteroidota bacterium]